jgi:predicted DNA-binding transcriptional regulator YafY
MADASTASRLLTLLSLLQGRRDWTGGDLADRLGVSGRTVRRDMERLRDLGYPVESVTGPAGGYMLRAGTAMPPLLLDDDEAIAIAVGLRTATSASVVGIEETALSALVKLEQVLPAPLRRRVQALSSSTVTLAARSGSPSVDPQCLTVLAAACRDHERVRFAYSGRDAATSRRNVEPHALVAHGRRWYLVAWDPGRDAWRTFRVDRINRPSAAGTRFEPRKLPGGDAATLVQRNLTSATSRYETTVTYFAPAEDVRRRMRWGADKVESLDDATCAYRTSDDDLDYLAMRIGMIGVDFDIDGPPELTARFARLGARFNGAAGRHSRARANRTSDLADG